LLAGGAPVTRAGQTLHPEMQILLAASARSMPTWTEPTPTQLRRSQRRLTRIMGGRPAKVGAVRDLVVDTPNGPLAARHYAPRTPRAARFRSPTRAPLLVFLHGGGFVFGDLDTHDAPCRLLCKHAGVHVLAVDYRLAPEHPFPAAVHDATHALLWAQAHAAELGADPEQVGIGGDSAGGNLAAVTALLAKEENRRPPACQVLLYPSVDATRVSQSMRDFSDGFYLTAEIMRWFRAQYMRDVVVPDGHVETRISPLRATDLGGLAPALVVTAAFDPLRDEGEAYAAALSLAGVDVGVRRFDGLIHGFMNMAGVSRAARKATLEIAAETRMLFARARARAHASAPARAGASSERTAA
jgi:acetyl esterase